MDELYVYGIVNLKNPKFKNDIFNTEKEAIEAVWTCWFKENSELYNPVELFDFAISLNRTLSIGDYCIRKIRI